MGCVSYSRRFFADGVISKENMSKAVLAGRLELRPVRHAFDSSHWKIAIGSSGTIRAIRTVVQEMGWSSKGISKESLKILRKHMIEQGHVDKLQIKGLSAERKPVFAGGVAVLSALFKALDIKLMQVSDEALREGLLYEMLGQFQDEDIRDKTVKTLSERHNIDKSQARRVNTTAMQLYEQVAEAWKLANIEYSDLLNWASRLHEIGLAIAHSQFHKHGAYILENADLSGFSRQQQHILAILVRTHRRKPHEDIYANLPKEITSKVKRLSIILRIAVLLHRGRSNERKPKLKLQLEDHNIHISFPADWLDEHPLTLVEMEQESKYLRNIGYVLTFS